MEKKDKKQMDDREKENLKCKHIDRTRLVGSQFGQSQPPLFSTLISFIKYTLILQDWVGFSMTKTSVMRAPMNPSWQWDQVHLQLWVQIMAGAHSTGSDHWHSGHVVQQLASPSGSRPLMGRLAQSWLLC